MWYSFRRCDVATRQILFKLSEIVRSNVLLQWAPRAALGVDPNPTVEVSCFEATPFIWGFPQMGAPQIGWLIMENPIIQMDDLGVPLF